MRMHALSRNFLWAVLLLPLFAGDLARAQVRPESFADLAERLKPTVVNIQVTSVERRSRFFRSPFGGGEGDPFEEFFKRFFGEEGPREFRRQGLGSGFVISSDGYIVTNNHVVENAAEIKVVMADKKQYRAKLIGSDKKTDIALLKVEPEGSLPAAHFGDSDALRVGDWVIAIGNPFGFGHTVTAGIVSAKGRIIGAGPYDDFIQTDASINPGNSGGPLFNLRGEVVGINTAIVALAQGIGFAIPMNMARRLIEQLRESGTVKRGFMGVVLQDLTPELAKQFGLKEPKGALVADVEEGSPADKGGLRRGDIVLEFEGKAVEDRHDLARMVAATEVGKVARLRVRRGADLHELKVQVTRFPEERLTSAREVEKTLGLTVQDLTPELAKRLDVPTDSGVLVSAVEPQSPAARAGIRRGDLILEVNRRPVQSVDAFTKAFSRGKEDHLVLIQRGRNKIYLVLPAA